MWFPSSRLPYHKEYTGKADLSSLMGEFKDLSPVDFSFRTAGRELEALSGEFELVNDNDPDKIKYIGEIGFTEKIKFEDE